jgi:two-component system sensor histidine kinase KdpD
VVAPRAADRTGETRRGDAGLLWAAWLGGLGLVTAAMVQVRASLGAAHVVLAYLVLVLGATARGGRALGLALAVLAFGCFNFFFVPPYHTFAVAAPLDWLVLGAFLVTSGIAAQLLARAQREASEARQRASEVDRLAALGAEALNAARAEDALEAVADVIRTSVAVTRCEVYLRRATPEGVRLAAASGPGVPPDPAGRGGEPTPLAPGGDTEREEWAPGVPGSERLVEWVAQNGRPAVTRPDGTLRFGDEPALAGAGPAAGASESAPADFDPAGARTLLLPLRVRDRTVGVLVLLDAAEITFDAARRRLLEALAYYAALAAERVRLAAEAEHADALRQADRLKDALLASVSHDLRTPLTTIKALAHDIGVSGDERAIVIEEEADRLNRFVADLLDLSRLAGGALTVAPELNTADDLVGAALQRVAGATQGRVIDVALDASEPLLVGRFDFSHALRILANLLENAVKYSPEDGPVDLVVARATGLAGTSGWLEVSVADRGAGVPPEERERIFAPFYRPAGSPPDAGSAGLGLSIARQLAEAQGGTLHCEPRPGGGSRFVLRLPGADIADVADIPLT